MIHTQRVKGGNHSKVRNTARLKALRLALDCPAVE
jgi:hypothetical protein